MTNINSFVRMLIVVGILILLIGVGIFYLNPKSYFETAVDRIIDKRAVEIVENYKKQNEVQKKEIEDLQKQIKQTESNVAKINKKIKGLEEDINENKPPESVEELRNRFRSLGFPAIN